VIDAQNHSAYQGETRETQDGAEEGAMESAVHQTAEVFEARMRYQVVRDEDGQADTRWVDIVMGHLDALSVHPTFAIVLRSVLSRSRIRAAGAQCMAVRSFTTSTAATSPPPNHRTASHSAVSPPIKPQTPHHRLHVEYACHLLTSHHFLHLSISSSPSLRVPQTHYTVVRLLREAIERCGSCGDAGGAACRCEATGGSRQGSGRVPGPVRAGTRATPIDTADSSRAHYDALVGLLHRYSDMEGFDAAREATLRELVARMDCRSVNPRPHRASVKAPTLPSFFPCPYRIRVIPRLLFSSLLLT
jgi:hypothetical protein